ncbi:pierisin-like [Pieris brassicae]|uniref:pierisin-like n=1 Tax=Pieris brassicae TaxID=7116 RepID=UPI001E65F210|nr:pierisin-like [Pieris brassicae]
MAHSTSWSASRPVGCNLFSVFIGSSIAMSNRGPPNPITNGIQAAVIEWIRSLDLELISLLVSRSWPMSILDISEPRWRPTEVTDTDNVVRMDRRQRLLRWDRRPPNEIFLEGFVPIVTREDPDWEETDLYGFAKNNHPSVFVSTTKTQRDKKKYVWTPRSANRGIVYQYEIYAPGGVDVNESLLHGSRWPNQMEVAFPGGIQNIYIRSARELRNGRIQRIWINPNFLDPLELENIASSSRTPNVIWRRDHPDGGHKDSDGRSKRSASSDDDLMYGGAGDVEEDTFGDDFNPKPFPDGEFMIESIQNNNSFLDLTENESGGIIHSHVYNGGDNQIWVFSYDENKKAYKLKSKQNSSLLLSWNSNATSEEIILRGYTESGSDNEYWRFEQTDDYYKLRNLVNLDMIITAQNKSSAFGGKEVIVNSEINTSDERNSQAWKVNPISFQTIPDGDYHIFNLGMSDNVVDFSNQNDFLIHGENYMDNENQNWKFTYDSGKRAYKIWSGRRSNLLLSWNSNAASKEMVLRVYPESGSKNQYWRIERTGDESYRLRNLENLSLILMLTEVSNPYGGLNLIVQDDSDTNTNLHSNWNIKPIVYKYIPDGDYHIFNDNFPNIVVDFTNQEDSLIHGYNYFGSNNQKWAFIYDENKKAYKIISGVRSDLLLSWNSNAEPQEVVLRAYTESGSMNQYWRLDQANDGSYRLRNLISFYRLIALTDEDSPYGGRKLIVSGATENGNTWYIKEIGKVAVPNGKFRIATKPNYKKVIESNQNNDLIISDNLNLVTSEWELKYDSSRKAYNIYSSDVNNLGWIYQNKKYFVKLGNIDGPDHENWRYFWTIEYNMRSGCYLIRSLHAPSHAVGYAYNNSVITDTSTYSDNQLFHFIPI